MGPPLGQAMEFLSQALSQRGPQAVPYPEGYKYNIREHVSELLKMFPALVVTTSEFHTNDGRVLNLLRIHGTVPIHFQGVKYNIPIVIWLPERYPQQAPLVYVTPTPNMIIKQGHTYVDPSGQVRTPCLANWLFPSVDLSTMVQEMAMVFGAEPPLYSKPANTPSPLTSPAYGGGTSSSMSYGQPYPSASQQQQATAYGGSLSQSPSPTRPAGSGTDPVAAGQALWGGAYAAAMQQQTQQQQQGALPHQSVGGFGGVLSPSTAAASAGYPPQGIPLGPVTSHQYQQPAAAAAAAVQPPPGPSPEELQKQELQGMFRGLAIKALHGRIQAGLEAYNRHAAGEVEGLLEVQRTLGQREAELSRMVAAIQQERTGTEGLVTELGSKCAALTSWLEEHEGKLRALGEEGDGAGGSDSSSSKALDVNRVVVPADDLSRQALAALAEDLALEDALVVLDKALLQGKMSPEVYLKQVRLLCRKQFFARAKGFKVAQAQRQQQQQPPPQGRSGGGAGFPGASGGSAYQLMHGDSWTHSVAAPIPPVTGVPSR